MSNAVSLMSSQRFGHNYLGDNTKDGERSDESDMANRDSSTLMPFNEEINHDDIQRTSDFLDDASTMEKLNDSDVASSHMSKRSGIDLAPYKNDIGNRFTTVDKSSKESFLKANPLAASYVSL